MRLAGDLLLLVGAIFMLLGGAGLVRMPDVYTRLQAGTKAVTLGALGLLAGLAFHHPDWIPKLLLIALFILLTSPAGSSTIARAARLSGLVPWQVPEDRGSGDGEGGR
jgi:multicomponent Na+:H+ antiporter subunit G